MSDTPYDCPDCGQPHPRGCHAHSARGTQPCGLRPVTGLTVCQVHGGRSPQSKAKAAKARAEQAAAREVARLGRRVEVHPAEALIDLEKRGAITTLPSDRQQCCGIDRDPDGFCQHRSYHPIYVEVPA